MVIGVLEQRTETEVAVLNGVIIITLRDPWTLDTYIGM